MFYNLTIVTNTKISSIISIISIITEGIYGKNLKQLNTNYGLVIQINEL